jgi:O-antigen/teichoic acid export membrane protein
MLALLFPFLGDTLGLPMGYTLLAAITALILNLNLLFLAIFQSSGQPWLYFHSRSLQGVAELVLCIVLIFLVVADASARIYSYTLALTASATLGLWYCTRRGHVGMHLDVTSVKGLFRFGVPMLPHVVAGTAITYLDRLVVSSLLGTESLGIYMVAMQIGMAMIALIEPLNKALAPWLFEQLTKDRDEVRQMVVKRTYQLFVLLVVIGVLVAVAVQLLFNQLIGAEFADACSLTPWMIAGFVMQGMYYTQVNYMFYAERTGMLSVVTGSIALVGCMVSYTLTSNFGLQGAAASFLINNSLLFLLVWLASSKAVPMPWGIRLKI